MNITKTILFVVLISLIVCDWKMEFEIAKNKSFQKLKDLGNRINDASDIKEAQAALNHLHDAASQIGLNLDRFATNHALFEAVAAAKGEASLISQLAKDLHDNLLLQSKVREAFSLLGQASKNIAENIARREIADYELENLNLRVRATISSILELANAVQFAAANLAEADEVVQLAQEAVNAIDDCHDSLSEKRQNLRSNAVELSEQMILRQQAQKAFESFLNAAVKFSSKLHQELNKAIDSLI